MIQIYAGLMFSGETLDPDEVTRATGLLPHLGHRKGDATPVPARSHGHGIWWFVTRDHLHATTEAALDDLFARLEPAWPVLVHLAATWETHIECYVRIFDKPPDREPWYGFSAHHVRKAAELGASLAIDPYDFRGSNVEPD